MPFGNHLQCPSEDCSTRCCRKTAWPQVPATHEYAVSTFETLQQISQPPFFSDTTTPNHKGFQANNNVGRKLR